MSITSRFHTELSERLGKECAHAEAEALAEACDDLVTLVDLATEVGVMVLVEIQDDLELEGDP